MCVTVRLSEGGSLIVEVDVFLGEHVSLFLQEVVALVFLLAEFVSGGRVPTEAGMSTVVLQWCCQECRDAFDTVIEVLVAESGIRAAVDSRTGLTSATTSATQGTASCRACWTVACSGFVTIGFAAVAAATFPLSTVVFELVVVVGGTYAPTESTLVVEEVWFIVFHLVPVVMEKGHKFLVAFPQVDAGFGGFAHGDDLGGHLIAPSLLRETHTLLPFAHLGTAGVCTVVPGVVVAVRLGLVESETSVARPAVKAVTGITVVFCWKGSSVIESELANVVVAVAAVVGKTVVVADVATVAGLLILS